jgi:hypothetical protein
MAEMMRGKGHWSLNNLAPLLEGGTWRPRRVDA